MKTRSTSRSKPSVRRAKKKPEEEPQKKAIVSRSAVERFIKERTGDRRAYRDAIDGFIRYIDELTLRLVTRAVEITDGAERSTISAEDVEAAFASIAARETEPGAVFSVIDQLSTDQLADLVNVIRDWLKERQRPPRSSKSGKKGPRASAVRRSGKTARAGRARS